MGEDIMTEEKTSEQEFYELVFGDEPVQDQVSQETIKDKGKAVNIIKYTPKEPRKIGDDDGKGIIDFILEEHPELRSPYTQKEEKQKETAKKEAEKPKIKQEGKKGIDDIIDRETEKVQEDTTQEATKKQEVIQETKGIKYKNLEIEHTNTSIDNVGETLDSLEKEITKEDKEIKTKGLVVKALVIELGKTYKLDISEEKGDIERFQSFGNYIPNEIRKYHINDSCKLIVGFDENENSDVALKMWTSGKNKVLDWIVLGYLNELDNIGDKRIERLYNELQDKESTEVLEPIRENVMKYVVTEYIRKKIGGDSKITFDEIIERLAKNKDKRQAVINEIRKDYEAISYFLENKLNENEVKTDVVLEDVIKEARKNPIKGKEGEINIDKMFDNIMVDRVDEEILKRDMIGMKGKDKKLEDSLGGYVKGIGNSVKEIIEGNKDAVSIAYKIVDAMESRKYNPKDIEGIIKKHKKDLTNKQIRFFYRILGKKKLIVNVGEEIKAIEYDDMKIVGTNYDNIDRVLKEEYLLGDYHTVDLIINDDKKEPEGLKKIVRNYFKDVNINILLNKGLYKPKYDRKQ